MGKNTNQKNLEYQLKYFDKQISQLKARIATLSKDKGSEYIVQCSTGGVEFKKYDICKVTDGLVAELFDGSESADDDMLPGIVIGGNDGDSTAEIFVLVSGVSYVKISEDITTGQTLYPYVGNFRQVSTSGKIIHSKALENGVVGKYIRVMIYAGAGGGTTEYYAVIKTVEADDLTYTADIYNEFASDMTFTDITPYEEDAIIKVPALMLDSTFDLIIGESYMVTKFKVGGIEQWVVTTRPGMS